ncbi:hypothetical protein [Stutzerimonas kunmingensis]|uniref:hypothetical protein n=1 Tax=Stutzerimonas kunmingensis TaxID=1211807 RepID=UPI00241CD59E|nr:hypothetical protein [Stutzerimonas kunmingensis]
MTIVAIDLFKSNTIPAVSVVDISPEQARQWLNLNIGNRPASQAHVAKLERSIREGKWKMTGDPIRFSKTGKLIDGQHRLQAILNSGSTVQCVVMRDLEDEIFNVIDSGKSRQKSDILFIELGLPVETCKVLASACGWVIDYEREQYGFHGKADKSDVLEFVTANPSLIESAIYAQALPHQSPVPRSIAAFFHFYASRRNQHSAERFLERFMVGTVDGADDNLLHLRNLCFTSKLNRRQLGRPEIIWRMIKIWNSEQRAKPIRYFSNTAVRQGEAFPTFI